MNKMNRYALIAALVMFLSGCMVQCKPAPVEEIKSVLEQLAQPQQPVSIVPTVPTIPQQLGPVEHEDQTVQPTPRQHHYDQNRTMQPMVGKMLQVDGVKVGGVPLVDSVNNRTNGSLNVGEATGTLCSAPAGSGKFTLISAQQLAVAKQQLGPSPNDSLGTRSKVIGIARNVGTQYVLYSSVSGNVNSPALQMQLMLIQTGGIIWSGKGVVQQQQQTRAQRSIVALFPAVSFHRNQPNQPERWELHY